MNASKRIYAVLGIVGIALIIGVYYGYSAGFFKKAITIHDAVEKIDGSTIRVYKDALENLKTTRISIMDFPDRLYLMGKIEITEDRTMVIPSRVTGRIERIYFASGEMVDKGQLLATLFSPDFVAAKEEYLQALKNSKPKAADNSDFRDLASLARKKLETLGLSEVDIQEIETDGDKSLLTDDPGTDPNSKASLMNLRAPRSGYIIAKGAILGNLVNIGDTLFTIGDMDKVWFEGDIYPEDLPKIHKGQEVLVAVTGSNKPLKGEVSFISPMVDPASRSIKIRALVSNPNGELKADMYVQGSVTLNDNKALLVPTTAVVRTPDGTVVYRQVTRSNTETETNSLDFKKVPVTLGNEQQGMVAIASGLEDGDTVVSDGAWLLDNVLNSVEK